MSRLARTAVAVTMTAFAFTAVPSAAHADPLPPIFVGAKQAWTYVSLTRPRQSFWNSTEDARVGRFDRAFFRLDTSGVTGARILDAALYVQRNAGECTPVELWLTGEITESTTWLRQPSWIEKLGVSSCSGTTTVTWKVAAAVTKAAAAGTRHLTFGLRAADPRDVQEFEMHKYLSPGLSISFNNPPAKPAGMRIEPGDNCYFWPAPCVPTGYQPTATPTLAADMSDGDTAGTGPQQIWGRFQWRPVGGELLGEATSEPSSQHHVPARLTVPEGGLADGGRYEWRVRSEDGFDTSGWSEWAAFGVDTTPPGHEPSVTSDTYPEEEWSGGVGVRGDIVLAPNGADEVAGYFYTLYSSDPTYAYVPAAADGTAVIPFTPSAAGPHRLEVKSVDRAGSPGPERTYLFYVR
ncbi:hypothetical protein [Nonomuraea soli]|uniref:DNRLRE domain-containing protein n=1 Tax=Nonomuraea soli TaxID=1032476 RepID=A0A7W0CSR0_9ACTN|nr:hypothetical protein [Nonomuraea soli]MBA2896610.1 hypothetical protein [Nonomuraea soli]